MLQVRGVRGRRGGRKDRHMLQVRRPPTPSDHYHNQVCCCPLWSKRFGSDKIM